MGRNLILGREGKPGRLPWRGIRKVRCRSRGKKEILKKKKEEPKKDTGDIVFSLEKKDMGDIPPQRRGILISSFWWMRGKARRLTGEKKGTGKESHRAEMVGKE